jgi:hypothetical protein
MRCPSSLSRARQVSSTPPAVPSPTDGLTVYTLHCSASLSSPSLTPARLRLKCHTSSDVYTVRATTGLSLQHSPLHLDRVLRCSLTTGVTVYCSHGVKPNIESITSTRGKQQRVFELNRCTRFLVVTALST